MNNFFIIECFSKRIKSVEKNSILDFTTVYDTVLGKSECLKIAYYDGLIIKIKKGKYNSNQMISIEGFTDKLNNVKNSYKFLEKIAIDEADRIIDLLKLAPIDNLRFHLFKLK